MGELVTIGRMGDLKMNWNSENEKETSAVKDVFEKKIKEGWSAFIESKYGEKGERIREFDPDARRIVLVPPISGG